jgi:hypothetical protein
MRDDPRPRRPNKNMCACAIHEYADLVPVEIGNQSECFAVQNSGGSRSYLTNNMLTKLLPVERDRNDRRQDIRLP